MREAVIVSAVRTAVGKAPKGTLRATRPDDLGAVAIQGALERVPGLDKKEVEDVIIGCAMPEARAGHERGAHRSLRAGMPIESAAMTVNRYCASGLQSIALAAERIRGGGADVIVAGGTESMSFVPMGGNKISINPWLMEHYPDSYLSMGLTAERVAQHYGIAREEADQFALASHQKALAAQAAGKFSEEIVPVPVTFTAPDAKSKPQEDRDRVQGGRRPARRYFARSAGQAQAGVPRQGHGDGGQLLADLGWRGRGGGDVRGARAELWASSRWRAWWPTPMPDACRRRWASGRSTPSPRRSSWRA